MSYAGKGSSRGGGSKSSGSSCHKGVTSGGDDQLPPPVRNHPRTLLSTAKAGSFDPHLSFIVSIEPLKPNNGNDGQPPTRTKEGFFLPPDKKEGYMGGDGPTLLLRWQGGRLYQVRGDDPIQNRTLQCYRTATVFTQHEDTPHLLTVPFDARKRNVRDEVNSWRPLTFNHQQIVGTNRYFSYVSCLGAETRIAATGSEHWMPQLLPDWYQYRRRPEEVRVQAGLIGDLSLLLALAAFSTPPTALGVLFTSIQPGAWNPHNNKYPTGHIPERGMVVTVSFDPRNPDHSVRESLDKLQNGDYGPFYGPQRPATGALSVSSTASSTAYATGPATGSPRGY